MPLDKYSAEFLGKNLFVLPFYGNGWIRENASSEPWKKIEMIGPKSFQLLVQDFLEFDNQLIGVRGIIVQKEHQFDGYHCLACLRMTGEYNVVDKPGHYMIWIARNEVHFSPAAEKAVYEYVIPDKFALCLCGYGTIADSPSRVQRYVEMAENTRRAIEDEGNPPE
jgi:hypothetical protein